MRNTDGVHADIDKLALHSSEMMSIVQKVEELLNHLAIAERYATLPSDRHIIYDLINKVGIIKAYLIRMSANVGQMATGFDQLSRRIEATLDDYDHEMSRLLAHYNNFE